jgi:hypothetical protein
MLPLVVVHLPTTSSCGSVACHALEASTMVAGVSPPTKSTGMQLMQIDMVLLGMAENFRHGSWFLGRVPVKTSNTTAGTFGAVESTPFVLKGMSVATVTAKPSGASCLEQYSTCSCISQGDCAGWACFFQGMFSSHTPICKRFLYLQNHLGLCLPLGPDGSQSSLRVLLLYVSQHAGF